MTKALSKSKTNGRNGVGRTSKLTDELQTNICNALRAGATYKDACSLVDVHYSTLVIWRSRAESGEKRYIQLFDAIQKALSHYKTACLSRIQSIAEGDPTRNERRQWQAWAWILERRFPDEFGRRFDIDVKGDAANVVVQVGGNETDYDHNIQIRRGDVRGIFAKYGLTEIIPDLSSGA